MKAQTREEILRGVFPSMDDHDRFPDAVQRTYIYQAMEIYKKKHEKEIADKAWEASWERFRQEDYGKIPYSAPAKEDFMKELLNPEA